MKKKILAGIVLLCLVVGGYVVYNNNIQEQEKIAQAEALQKITDRYNTYVVTNKDAPLYELESGSYREIGQIKSGYPLTLAQQDIDLDTTHFLIENLPYYISIQDVDKTDGDTEKDNRYQQYIVFNENVKTKDVTNFYDEYDELRLTINQAYEFPIIIKGDGKYGIEFDNTLYYVKDIETTVSANNTDVETRTNIRPFTYHTVYDTNTQTCGSIEICHPIEQFEEQMKYLSDEGFLTLTMEELELFLNGSIRVPVKTVVLTLDDGIYLENSIPIVEKYGVYATFFIITSRTDVTEYMDSKYARFESHTDDMHNNYVCPKNTTYSQGGQMLCEDYDSMIADLKLSQEKLKGSYYFAYPFFDFNDQAKNALRDAGFHLAFIGQYTSNGYSDQNTDKMMIRRKTIFGNFSLETFIDLCNDLDDFE